MSSSLLAYLDFYLDIHSGRQVEPHERVNSLGIRLQHIDQPLVRANLKVLVRILVNERASTHGESLQLGWQRNRAHNPGSCPLGRFHNPLGRLIKYAMIVCF